MNHPNHGRGYKTTSSPERPIARKPTAPKPSSTSNDSLPAKSSAPTKSSASSAPKSSATSVAPSPSAALSSSQTPKKKSLKYFSSKQSSTSRPSLPSKGLNPSKSQSRSSFSRSLPTRATRGETTGSGEPLASKPASVPGPKSPSKSSTVAQTPKGSKVSAGSILPKGAKGSTPKSTGSTKEPAGPNEGAGSILPKGPKTPKQLTSGSAGSSRELAGPKETKSLKALATSSNVKAVKKERTSSKPKVRGEKQSKSQDDDFKGSVNKSTKSARDTPSSKSSKLPIAAGTGSTSLSKTKKTELMKPSNEAVKNQADFKEKKIKRKSRDEESRNELIESHEKKDGREKKAKLSKSETSVRAGAAPKLPDAISRDKLVAASKVQRQNQSQEGLGGRKSLEDVEEKNVSNNAKKGINETSDHLNSTLEENNFEEESDSLPISTKATKKKKKKSDKEKKRSSKSSKHSRSSHTQDFVPSASHSEQDGGAHSTYSNQSEVITPDKSKTTCYIGVVYRSRRDKFQARLYRGNREYILGSYDLACDAALAYDTAHRIAGGKGVPDGDVCNGFRKNGECEDECEYNGNCEFGDESEFVRNDHEEREAFKMLNGIEEVRYSFNWLDCALAVNCNANLPPVRVRDDRQDCNFGQPSNFRIARKKEIQEFLTKTGAGERSLASSVVITESDLKLRVRSEIVAYATSYVAEFYRQEGLPFPTDHFPPCSTNALNHYVGDENENQFLTTKKRELQTMPELSFDQVSKKRKKFGDYNPSATEESSIPTSFAAIARGEASSSKPSSWDTTNHQMSENRAQDTFLHDEDNGGGREYCGDGRDQEDLQARREEALALLAFTQRKQQNETKKAALAERLSAFMSGGENNKALNSTNAMNGIADTQSSDMANFGEYAGTGGSFAVSLKAAHAAATARLKVKETVDDGKSGDVQNKYSANSDPGVGSKGVLNEFTRKSSSSVEEAAESGDENKLLSNAKDSTRDNQFGIQAGGHGQISAPNAVHSTTQLNQTDGSHHGGSQETMLEQLLAAAKKKNESESQASPNNHSAHSQQNPNGSHSSDQKNEEFGSGANSSSTPQVVSSSHMSGNFSNPHDTHNFLGQVPNNLTSLLALGGTMGFRGPIPPTLAEQMKLAAMEQNSQGGLGQGHLQVGGQFTRELPNLMHKQLANEARRANLAQKLSTLMGGNQEGSLPLPQSFPAESIEFLQLSQQEQNLLEGRDSSNYSLHGSVSATPINQNQNQRDELSNKQYLPGAMHNLAQQQSPQSQAQPPNSEMIFVKREDTSETRGEVRTSQAEEGQKNGHLSSLHENRMVDSEGGVHGISPRAQNMQREELVAGNQFVENSRRRDSSGEGSESVLQRFQYQPVHNRSSHSEGDKDSASVNEGAKQNNSWIQQKQDEQPVTLHNSGENQGEERDQRYQEPSGGRSSRPPTAASAPSNIAAGTPSATITGHSDVQRIIQDLNIANNQNLDEETLHNIIMKKRMEELNKEALERRLGDLVTGRGTSQLGAGDSNFNNEVANLLNSLHGNQGSNLHGQEGLANLLSQQQHRFEEQRASASPALNIPGGDHGRNLLQSFLQERGITRIDQLDPSSQAALQSLLGNQRREGPLPTLNNIPGGANSLQQLQMGSNISDAVTYDVVNRRLAIETMLMSEESRLRQLRESLQGQFIQPQSIPSGGMNPFSFVGTNAPSVQQEFLERERANMNDERALLAGRFLQNGFDGADRNAAATQLQLLMNGQGAPQQNGFGDPNIQLTNLLQSLSGNNPGAQAYAPNFLPQQVLRGDEPNASPGMHNMNEQRNLLQSLLQGGAANGLDQLDPVQQQAVLQSLIENQLRQGQP